MSLDNTDKIVILIPAYKPSLELLTLVDELKKEPYMGIVVVDDGGGEEYRKVFAQLPESVSVCVHPVNKGKGEALKTGLKYIIKEFPDCQCVVTCDADGQHTPEDIKKVGLALFDDPDCPVLGCRCFKGGDVPTKSKLGNNITKVTFFLASGGVKVSDTQTGLRALPKNLLKSMTELDGERYEYEINMLLYFTKHKININEVSIETVYINDNAGSHFKPFRDSYIIYSSIIKFCAASFSSFLLDFLLLFLFRFIFRNYIPQESLLLLVSVISSRILSSAFNYIVNQKLVFKKNSRHSLFKYVVLMIGNLIANYLLLSLLNIVINMPLGLSKILVELFLFFSSYYVQKKLIFIKSEKELK